MRTVRIPGLSLIPRAMVGARLMTALAGLAFFVPGAAAAPAPSAAAQPPVLAVDSADACVDSEEVTFLALINDYRAASGLGPLSVSSSLSSAAAYHSIDMAANGYLDHSLLDGTSVEQNMANFGYTGSTYGENIAAGMGTASEALQTWQGSAGHNANMLNGSFGAIGIGRAYDAASPYGWYWTTIFSDESDGPGWLCGEAAPASKTVSLFQSVDGAVSAGDVNLRTGPGPTYNVVTTLPASTPMTVTGREQNAFLPVKVDGQFGWVAAEWVERGAIALEQTAAPSQPGTATAVDTVELLDGPFGTVLGSIPAVALVTLTGQAQDGFLGVTYEGQQGWANAAYLAVADVTGNAMLAQPAEPTTAATAGELAAAPAQPVQSTVGMEAMATMNVNLRAQPSATAPVLTIVPAGSSVVLTGSQANGYVNVRFNGQAGWMDSQYVQ
jgi:uncharacterized protein YkwD/uncharacterized protein YraI